MQVSPHSWTQLREGSRASRSVGSTLGLTRMGSRRTAIEGGTVKTGVTLAVNESVLV